MGFIEAFDNFAGLRNGLSRVASERGDWAGIPMPIEGQRLIIEPKFPNGLALSEIGAPTPEKTNGETLRNSFWSHARRQEIIVWNNADGSLEWGACGRTHGFNFIINTILCSSAWGVKQESNAVQTLAGLITYHQFKTYMLTGMFIESSKRSKVMYLFRRLRPTVALRLEGETARILCTLCLHPIAYYGDSWAGAMCPTDDVIAHLMLMRGDEHMFWRQANQHPSWKPESGL